ncbi:MAG: Hpt domain-containing protein, partial [Oricola sp.]|nr:Hpt domain-containing protein [Oricola sp.]
IRAIEARTGRARIPIVALTAHVAGKEDAWRAAGMDEYLTKPFTLGALSALLAKYLAPGDPLAAPAASTDDALDIGAGENDGVFDRKVLAQIAAMQAGGVNLPLRALAMFDEHSRTAIKSLAATLKTGDNEAIASAAHALKSMSVNVGARSLGAACADIERQARAGASKAALSTCCKAAAAAFRETHAALPALVAEYKRSAA